MIEIWRSEGSLGTRARQHEANVTAKLKDDPDRPDRDVLSDTRARFGAERLAPVIRECWRNGPANEDVRELLVEMIWQGRIEDCADLARSVALDASLHAAHRTIAVRALVACGGDDSVREVADAILAHPES